MDGIQECVTFLYILYYNIEKVVKRKEKNEEKLILGRIQRPTIPHKNIETNNKFYRKVAFLMYMALGCHPRYNGHVIR